MNRSSRSHRGTRWLCALYVLVLGAWAGAALAQDDAPTIRIAVIDVARANQEFKLVGQKLTEIGQWQRQQQNYLDQLRTKYSYLTEEHFNEVLDILQMPMPRPAKYAKRLRELDALNNQKEDRFIELQDKVGRTAQEQDEFAQLQETEQARTLQLEGIGRDLQGQLIDRQRRAQLEIGTLIADAVSQVAREGGYHLVLSAAVVLYGGDDITDDVLTRLNGEPPQRPAAPAAEEGGQ